jgi:hypothetical protein
MIVPIMDKEVAMNKKEDKIIAADAKLYGLDGENPPDITDPEISRATDERIAQACRPELEKWAQFEAASRAYAKNVWTP